MTHQEIKLKCEIIYRFLAHNQLKDAFDALLELIKTHSFAQYNNRLENLQTTYKYMLKYTVESANDPERQKVYNKLFEDTYQLCGEIEDHLLEKYSSQLPYTLLRAQRFPGLSTSFTALYSIKSQYEMVSLSESKEVPFEIRNSYQHNITEVFMNLWASNFYDEETVSEVQKAIKGKYLKDYELSLLTSASSLSLWRHFDCKKFEILFDLANNESELVKQRAYIGILIAIYIYNDRLKFFSGIKSRFALLAENSSFVKAIESIIIQFIRSKESEKIAKKLTEEIIPEMIKLSPQMRNKLNFNNEDEGQHTDDDKNPDWQEILDEVPGLTDKMKEISHMQMEGADIFLSTFSMLKSFPFFNQLHNWLVPFSSDYPEISNDAHSSENTTFVNAIKDSHFMCNSDKYSFLLSLQQMPDAQRSQMTGAISAEFDGMKDIEKDRISLNNSKKGEFISNQYVQDLYRLFNLHPSKGDFENIFNKRLDFHNKAAIAQLIEDPKIWRNVAEYYFSKNYFEEAAELFDHLLAEDGSNVELLQKRGYCAQKQSNYQDALNFYLKADLVEENNSWTIKKIAYCYRVLEQTKEALQYYQQAIKLQPKNSNIQMYMGYCQLALDQYDDALNTFFKVELESKKPEKVWQAIAWTSFIATKLDQAQKYYTKILANSPNAHDFINAGHVALASDDKKQALAYYKQAVDILPSIDDFLKILEEDKPYILAYGIEESDLPILLDGLRYDIEN